MKERLAGVRWKGRGPGGGSRGGQAGGWRRLPKRLGGGYWRLQLPLKLALAVRRTVAGHRLRSWRGRGGDLPPFQCIAGGGGRGQHEGLIKAAKGTGKGPNPVVPSATGHFLVCVGVRLLRGGSSTRGGGGGGAGMYWKGGGVWDRKVCVPKMAQSDFSNGKFRLFSRGSLWSGGGGVQGVVSPPPPAVHGHSNTSAWGGGGLVAHRLGLGVKRAG